MIHLSTGHLCARRRGMSYSMLKILCKVLCKILCPSGMLLNHMANLLVPLPDYAWKPTGLCVETYRTMRKIGPEPTGLCATPYRTMRSRGANPLKSRDSQLILTYRTMRR